MRKWLSGSRVYQSKLGGPHPSASEKDGFKQWLESQNLSETFFWDPYGLRVELAPHYGNPA